MPAYDGFMLWVFFFVDFTFSEGLGKDFFTSNISGLFFFFQQQV